VKLLIFRQGLARVQPATDPCNANCLWSLRAASQGEVTKRFAVLKEANSKRPADREVSNALIAFLETRGMFARQLLRDK
jgi:hypothetical protein